MIQTGQYLGTLSKLTLKSGAENPRPPLKVSDEEKFLLFQYGEINGKLAMLSYRYA